MSIISYRKQLIPQLMLSVRSSIGRDNVWGVIPDQAGDDVLKSIFVMMAVYGACSLFT
jgi:hypothetical protein